MSQKSPIPTFDDNEREPLYIPDPNTKDLDERPSETKLHPRETKLRWIVLLLTIGTNYGGFFCNDNPQALQTAIQQNFGVADAEFNLLYSMAILPNVILPFIGGMATDYFGVGFTMLVVGALVLIGQSVVAFGAFLSSFPVMVIGRFIFGSGFQTLENTLLIVISKWFLDKELSFSYGITRTILRTATSLNSFMTPVIYGWTGSILVPIMLGVVLVTISLICTIVVVGIDKKADREFKADNEPKVGAQQISFKEIKNLPKLYFLMMVIGLLVYAAFYGFTNNVNSFLVHRFGFTSERAGLLIMIIYITAALLSPFVGLLIDRVGKRTIFVLVGGLVLLFSHGLLLFLEDRTPENPNYTVIIGLIGLGVFYSVFSPSYWTSLPMIVAPQAVGVGVGLVMSSLAITQAVYTEVIGLIHDNTSEFHSGYYWTQACHCIVCCLVVLMAICAYFEDARGKAVLYKPRQKTEVKTE